MRPSKRTIIATSTGGVLALLVVGCGIGRDGDDSSTATGADSATSSSPALSRSPRPDSERTGRPSGEEENSTNINIVVDGANFTATLDGSAAARDLAAQLPIRVQMNDHGGVEKTGSLPGPLSLEGQPEGADPDIGDVGYYAPGNDLVLYYGDQTYYPGIVVLGRMHGDAAEQIARMNGAVTVTVEAQ